ncbi:MAG: SDR family oxidoreductase [Oscillochloris sp.]|nr:SDR family oxidoreductase [Oscillochloris sp.]
MRVLVTGTDGYIGTMLVPALTARGHEVIGVDTGFYRSGWLFNGANRLAATINKDIRNLTVEDLQGCEAVVHMAELSNDPLGQLNPDITYKINHQGSLRLAQLCKEAGITRFVYMSSCSVYGVGEPGETKSEASMPQPQTAYAKCKVMVERDVLPMAADDFSPVFLRNATAYGPSPRMRFDIVLNNLSGLAWVTKEIKMTSDGSPWRPLVHILDIANAIGCCLEAPREAIHGQIFNVGASRENYQVRDIAAIVGEVFPECAVSFGNSDGDNRSYKVDFSKINTQLPGFSCTYTARDGARQLLDVFERVAMQREVFEGREYTRLKQLQYLIGQGWIDNNFFWKI